ncbi:MAG: hypothetical protein GQ538_05510 [Xanthomonadales bacterium]|nr:hypothetical protein [Xanthomonadales bacterium]
MQQQPDKKTRIRTAEKSRIWLALVIALGLHVVIFFLPATRQSLNSGDKRAQIEVQLINPIQQPTMPVPVMAPDPPLPELEPEIESLDRVVETKADTALANPEPAALTHESGSDFDRLSNTKEKHLANTILSAQFITEESISEQIFGKQFDLEIADPQKEFHFPARQGMVAMLDPPMPELPFAYTPGLVRFAYAPGVKGDMQRFWDVITPEFGWRTKNGTEFKCIWVLIIGGCGWK